MICLHHQMLKKLYCRKRGTYFKEYTIIFLSTYWNLFILFYSFCKLRPFIYTTISKLVLQYAFLRVQSNLNCKSFFTPQAALWGPLLLNFLLIDGPVLSTFHSGFAKQLLKRAAVDVCQKFLRKHFMSDFQQKLLFIMQYNTEQWIF